MAALQRDRARLASVPGVEWADRGYALADIDAGELILIDSTPESSGEYDMRVDVAGTGDTKAHGVAIKDVKAGGLCEFAIMGELDGFVGLTPGDEYTIVDGVIDDTAPVAGGKIQIRARNEHSVYFNFMS